MLRDALAAAHYNQAGLACELGVTQQAVSGWLRGRCKPSLASMLRLEESFGIPVATWAEKPARRAA